MPVKKPLIYVAGPYTKPDPIINTRLACEFGEIIHEAGGVPIIPHLSMLQHLIKPRDINFWYAYDLDLLYRCDALYRFEGESTGADREVEFASNNGIPVYLEGHVVINAEWIKQVKKFG